MTESEAPPEPLEPSIQPETSELADNTELDAHAAHADTTDVEHDISIPTNRSRSSRKKLWSLATVLVLVAAVLIVVLSSSSSKALTPREAVIAAETAAAKPSTMSFALAESISTTKGNSFQVVNDPLRISGAGAIDRATHSVDMHVKIKVATLTVHLREILSKKSVFIKFGALTPYLKSGKTWVQVPSSMFASKSSVTNVGASPVILKDIRKKEIKITADGSGTVNGTKVYLYKLKPNAAATKQLAGAQASGVLGVRISFTYVLGIDSQHVIRQIRMAIVQSVDNTHELENLSMTILNYNQPVVIGQPSTKETEKLDASQYAKLIKSSQAAPPSLV